MTIIAALTLLEGKSNCISRRIRSGQLPRSQYFLNAWNDLVEESRLAEAVAASQTHCPFQRHVVDPVRCV